MQPLYRPHLWQHRRAKLVTPLVFVGMLGIALPACAQIMNIQPDGAQVDNIYPTREPVPMLNDWPDTRPPVGFAPPPRGAEPFPSVGSG